MSVYIFLGPPGAGKGTMAKIYCTRTGAVHVSTGDILRDEMARGTDLGLRVRAILDSGKLVTDETVAELVENRISQQDIRENGCLLDGFPRTLHQCRLLDGILERTGQVLQQVILLDADRDLLIQRLTARRICRSCGAVFNVLFTPPKKEGVCDACGAVLVQRSDDTAETAVSRLDVYARETSPLVDFYEAKGLLKRVDTVGSVDDNYAALSRAMHLE